MPSEIKCTGIDRGNRWISYWIESGITGLNILKSKNQDTIDSKQKTWRYKTIVRPMKKNSSFTCTKNAISITRLLRYPRTRLTTPLATVEDPISIPSWNDCLFQISRCSKTRYWIIVFLLSHYSDLGTWTSLPLSLMQTHTQMRTRHIYTGTTVLANLPPNSSSHGNS